MTETDIPQPKLYNGENVAEQIDKCPSAPISDALKQRFQTEDAWLQKKKERIYWMGERAIIVLLVMSGWFVTVV